MRPLLQTELGKPFVHIVFGARQTGKTTLLSNILDKPALRYNLADPEDRTRLMADPGAFRRECEALPQGPKPLVVFIDEAQRVPHVFDAVQVLYDQNPTRWRFILCGSSARKLRKAGTNLLPGRCIMHRLYPLVLAERPPLPFHETAPLLPLEPLSPLMSSFPAAGIEERLAFGELPGIVLLADADRGPILRSFATAHLEEEIRKEALVEDWGAFVNFLRLAAAESGRMTNYAAISQEVGLSQPTVKSHYQLLEDMFLGFRLPAYTRNPRKNLLSTPRFFFTDIGLCHAARGLTPNRETPLVDPGRFFEQWVVTEIWKRIQYLGRGQLHYLATKDGMEIDLIIELDERVIPIEIKWNTRPDAGDARHLVKFIHETPRAETGYVVCRCPRRQQLAPNVVALPWQEL